MAIRIQGTTVSRTGQVFNLMIDDADFWGSPIDIDLSGEGFRLIYDTEDEVPEATIMTSECEFAIVVKPSYSADIKSLIADMSSSDEGRFRIRIERGNGNLFWAGFMLPDKLYFEDEDWAFVWEIRLRATDGLGRLEAIEYNDDGDPYEGRQTIRQHIMNVLAKVGLDDFWGAAENYLLIINRFYAANMGAANENDNPLDRTWVNHRALYSIARTGEYEYRDCLSVLKEMLLLNLSRIYISDGAYRVDQIPDYKNDGSIYRHRYYKGGTKAGTNSSVSLEIDEGTDQSIRLANTRYSYFAALRRAEIEYTHLNDANLTPGAAFSNSATTDYLRIFEFTNDGRLWLRGKTKDKVDFTALGSFASITPPCRVIYRFKVKIKIQVDSATFIDYYLKRGYAIYPTGAVTYDNAEWTTDTGAVAIFVSEVQQYDSDTVFSFLDILTPPMPSGERCTSITLNMQPGSIVKGSTAQDSLTYTHTWEFRDSITQVIVEDESVLITKALYRRNNADSPNASIVNKYEISFGDAYNYFTSATITVGATANESLPSTGWRRGFSGVTQQLQHLFLQELIKLRKLPLERLDGGMLSASLFAHNLIKLTNARKYALLRGTWESVSEQWDGTWFYVSTSDTITNVTVHEVPVEPGFEPGFEPPTPPPQYEPWTSSGEDGAPDVFLVFGNAGQVITLSSAGIDRGVSTTQIPITPIGVDGLIKDGDEVAIVDNITGVMQIFIVDGDVGAADTFITVLAQDTVGDFGENSHIVLSTTEFYQNLIVAAEPQRYVQDFDMDGTSVTVTVTQNGGVLPVSGAYLDVHYNGAMLKPTSDYTYTGSIITFNFKPENGTWIRVTFWA